MSSPTFVQAPESLDNDSASSPADAGPDPIAPIASVPYGTTASGTPRRKPGRKPGQRNGTGRAATAPPRATGGKFTKDYRPAVRAMLELPQAALLGAAVALGDPACALDAAAIDAHAEPVANAVHQLALDKPEVAAALERMTTAGGYMALVAAVVPLLAQLAANHNLIPAGFMSTNDSGILTAGAKAAKVDNPNEYPPALLYAAARAAQKAPARDAASTPADTQSEPIGDAAYLGGHGPSDPSAYRY